MRCGHLHRRHQVHVQLLERSEEIVHQCAQSVCVSDHATDVHHCVVTLLAAAATAERQARHIQSAAAHSGAKRETNAIMRCNRTDAYNSSASKTFH